MINNIISAIGGAVVALAIAGFLLRTMIKHLLNKETIRYAIELEQKSEVLKTELSIFAHEQNVGLTRLDQQRADAIQELYGLMTAMNDAIIELVQPNLVERASVEAVLAHYYSISTKLVDQQDKLSASVERNAILFDVSSYDIIANYGLTLSDTIIDFHSDTFASEMYMQDPIVERTLGHFEKRRKQLRTDVQDSDFNNAKAVLLEEFRRLMKAKSLPTDRLSKSIDK